MPECKKCQSHFPNRKKIDGKIRVLNSRKYCLDCSPFSNHNTVKIHIDNSITKNVCSMCNKKKESSDFYNKTATRKQSSCKSCFNVYCIERWRQRKKDAIKYMGEKCIDCKKTYHYSVYDFHHVDGKDYSWTKLRLKSWKTIIKELNRCVLLCSNCHRTRHYGSY